MNSRQFAQVATALCGTVGLAGWVVASLAGLGSADIENGVVSIEDRRSPYLTGKVVDAPRATTLGNIAVASRKSPFSLYRTDLSSFTMGESYDQKDAAGFIRILGLPLRSRAQARQKSQSENEVAK